MLCNDVLTLEDYKRKVKTMGADIASANYQQEPIDVKGRYIVNFKPITLAQSTKRFGTIAILQTLGKTISVRLFGARPPMVMRMCWILFTLKSRWNTQKMLWPIN